MNKHPWVVLRWDGTIECQRCGETLALVSNRGGVLLRVMTATGKAFGRAHQRCKLKAMNNQTQDEYRGEG